jgi:hypothetical protein
MDPVNDDIRGPLKSLNDNPIIFDSIKHALNASEELYSYVESKIKN